MKSEGGYTWCGCRDCFETAIDVGDGNPMCWECKDAGCDPSEGMVGDGCPAERVDELEDAR